MVLKRRGAQKTSDEKINKWHLPFTQIKHPSLELSYSCHSYSISPLPFRSNIPKMSSQTCFHFFASTYTRLASTSILIPSWSVPTITSCRQIQWPIFSCFSLRPTSKQYFHMKIRSILDSVDSITISLLQRVQDPSAALYILVFGPSIVWLPFSPLKDPSLLI